MSFTFFILFCSNPGRNQCNCVGEHSPLDENILRWSYYVRMASSVLFGSHIARHVYSFSRLD